MHDKVSFFVDGTSTGRRVRAQSGDDKGRHNFVTDPWSRHVIQVEGETVPALVVLCTEGYTKHQAFLMIASARGFGRGGVPVRSRGLKTRVRSLGYVGPFLQQYGKAAQLVKGGDNRLLDAIASPGRQTGVRGPGGTFVPADVGALDTSRVPLNPAQRVAVLKLSGGLDIVVGPPGRILSTPDVCTYLVSIGALMAFILLTAQNHELPRSRLVLFLATYIHFCPRTPVKPEHRFYSGHHIFFASCSISSICWYLFFVSDMLRMSSTLFLLFFTRFFRRYSTHTSRHSEHEGH